MSHDVNLLNPCSRIAVFSSSSSEGKEEEFPISEKEALPSIDMLSDDVLGGRIFNYTTNGCRKNLGAIRGTCRKWREVFDAHNLRVSWGILPKKIKNPSLRVLVNQIVFIDRFVSDAIASAIHLNYAALPRLDQADILNRIKDMGPSAFSRFSQLTQSLREKGAPIPRQHAVIGFELSPYEKMQRKLDTSLEIIWTLIRQQINLEGAPIPTNAETIREWLSNPINADKIARITDLRLSYKELEILSPEIGKLSGLTSLYLDRNQLTTLPPEIANLSQLKELCVSNNHLTTLPPEIGKLSKLISLSLSENELTALPLEIAKLSQLKYLDLAHNWLLKLPPGIGNLSQLQEFNLFNNPLTTLPSEIFKLSRKIRNTNLHDTLIIFTLNPDFCKNNSVLSKSIYYSNQVFLDCSNYSCRTPLGSLCQKIHLGYESDLLRDTFETLPSDMQDRIRQAKKQQHANQAIRQAEMQQWIGRPRVRDPATWSSSSSEMEADLFADNASFVSAVITALRGKWRSLSEDEQSQVRDQFMILARQSGKSMVYAQDNIICWIDSMELVI